MREKRMKWGLPETDPKTQLETAGQRQRSDFLSSITQEIMRKKNK